MADLRWGLMLALCLISGTVSAMGPENVLVLYNADSPAGLNIANYYSEVHPGVRMLGLQGVPTSEVISADTYLQQVRPQVLSALDSNVDCIVTTKGLPLRIVNSSHSSVYSSLESELTRIDSIDSKQLMGNQIYYLPPMWGGNPLSKNPYYTPQGGDASPFSYQQYGVRLASRLDGFCEADVIAAIDRAQKASYGGETYPFGVLVDDNLALGYGCMTSLVDHVLEPAGIPVTYDGTSAFIREAPGSIFGYVGHGTNGGAPEGYLLDGDNGLDVHLAPGAVFHTYESYNAYSFSEGGNRYGQALVAEWLAAGGTVGLGHVEEPTATSTCVSNEDRVFEMLLDGYTWAEAAWAATYQLSYVNTVVGDPLMVLETYIEGDTDRDGDVDAADLGRLGMSFNREGYWEDGDCNNDGFVGPTDLAILGMNWKPGGYIANPEPASATVLLICGTLVFGRRRRR